MPDLAMSADLLVSGALWSLQAAASKRQESARANEARQNFMTAPFPMCPAIRGRAPTHGRGWFEHIVRRRGCQSNSPLSIRRRLGRFSKLRTTRSPATLAVVQFPHYFSLAGYRVHPHLVMELIAYTGGFQLYLL